MIRCSRCVMDTTDPDISFDERGVCSHCASYEYFVKHRVFSGEEGQRRLNPIVDSIRSEGKGKDYDCVIGISGGVDSTYVAYKVKQLGLRPLAVHLDNGWDSELAVQNIENTLKILNIDLYTHVIDWEEFKDIQLAFLKAGVPDLEIPSDHAIFAILHHTARRLGLKTIIWGLNVRTETHMPAPWSQGHYDWKYIQSIHRKFGRLSIKTFPHLDFSYYLGRHKRTQRNVSVLDYLDYVKKDAIKVLEKELGWKYYGGKHYESIYTRFYQGYILPTRFGFDKRKSHLSSLICSGEITREQALAELAAEPYPLDLQNLDREYVTKKLGLTAAEFEQIMRLPKKSFADYPSYARFLRSWPYTTSFAVYQFVKYKVLRLNSRRAEV